MRPLIPHKQLPTGYRQLTAIATATHLQYKHDRFSLSLVVARGPAVNHAFLRVLNWLTESPIYRALPRKLDRYQNPLRSHRQHATLAVAAVSYSSLSHEHAVFTTSTPLFCKIAASKALNIAADLYKGEVRNHKAKSLQSDSSAAHPTWLRCLHLTRTQ